MTPPFDEIRDSGAAPAAPEMEADESQPLEPSVPAGEPEAPVGPAAPVQTPEEDADAPEEGAPEPGLPDEEGRDARQLERDLDELTARAQKADEYLELAQRTRADFENYRKRAARDAAAAQERGVVKLVRELLPAVDNLDRALESVSTNGDSQDEFLSEIKLVHAEVIAALGRAGVELYSPEGEKFDPTRHEAVAQQPVDGAEAGTVVEVYQRGCRLGESVIRPARVVVAG
ncbi:MAG TPA: nucleotide exchange factor GrpE [Solirubrobacteraceae bacterium]|nr:nucleotide exchange factor GrpE [Solirubrobacteraceae bacterium]